MFSVSSFPLFFVLFSGVLPIVFVSSFSFCRTVASLGAEPIFILYFLHIFIHYENYLNSGVQIFDSNLYA